MPLYRTDALGPNATDTLGRALANHLLPTPVAGDGTKASSNPATSNKRIIDGRQAYLADIVQTELLQLGDEHWIETGSFTGSEVLDLLGTPCANPTVRTKFRSRNPNPAELVELLNESKTPLLKTPLASDEGSLDRPERYLNRNKPGGRFDLSDQVASLLPTPLASDYNQAGFQPSLLDPARSESISVAIMNLLPTPRAQNGESRNQNIYARPLDQPQNLENALALLPTPTVMDMGSNYTPEEWEAWKLKQKEAHRNGNGHGASLTQEALSLLPTPTVADTRDGKYLRQMTIDALKRGASRGLNLNHLVETLWEEMAHGSIGESTTQPLGDGSESSDDQPQIQLSPE